MKKKKNLPPWVLVCNSKLHEHLERARISFPEHELLNLIFKLTQCKNALQQVTLVKQISQHVKQCSGSDPRHVELCLRIFVDIFLHVELKNALKKTVSSILQCLDEPYYSFAITCLKEELQTALSSYNVDSPINEFKQVVDNVIASLDNFSSGITAIIGCYNSVLNFFAEGFSFLSQELKSKTKPQEIAELFSVYQVTLKALLMTLQLWDKCSTSEEHVTSLKEIYLHIFDLLLQDNIPLNCQASAAIAAVLICKYYSGSYDNCLHYLLTSQLESLELAKSALELSASNVRTPYFMELPENSRLCILAGIMAVFDVEHLSRGFGNETCLLTDVILPEILSVYSAVDHTRLLCCSRTLLLWTEKVCIALQDENTKLILLERLNYDSVAIQQILCYVYNHWEHFIDTVRYQAQDILRNILLIHSTSSVTEAQSRAFMTKLSQTLLLLPWHQRGKYGALQCVVKHAKCDQLLKIDPTLPVSVLKASKENCLACHVGELYESLYRKHREECDLKIWQNTWLYPLLNVLLGKSKVQKSCVQLYILPKLFKLFPDALKFITADLLHKLNTSDNSIGALLTCLRIANTLGLLSTLSDKLDLDSLETWEEIIPLRTLKTALCSVEDEIRLDALSLLCSSPKSKQPLCAVHYEMLRHFVPHNMFSQSPAFRQQMLSHFKKFFNRLIETFTILQREKEQLKDAGHDASEKLRAIEENISIIKNFVWVIGEFFFFCINLRCNFPCRCTALQALSIMNGVFDISTSNESCDKYLPKSEHVVTLVHCLRDTYENNKKLALELLTSLPSIHYFQDEMIIEEHIQAALNLAFSIRPPDSVTAAYIFQFLVKFETTSKVARKLLNRNLVDTQPAEESQHDSNISFDAINLLLFNFKSNLKSSLCDSSKPLLRRKPLFGLLSCVRALLSGLNFREIPLSNIHKWRILIADLIDLSFEAIQLVMEVLSGNCDEDYYDGDYESLLLYEFEPLCEGEVLSDLQNLASMKTEIELNAIKAQIALLFSWRMHKEVSLILGAICENAEIGEAPLQSTAILSTYQVKEIGKFFIDQMSRVTHRGAFEQAYLGFCQICHTLWRSTVGDLHQLPKKWLHDLMLEIKGESKSSSHFCSTRRSAGVPFMVQALLITEPDVTNSSCFSEAMTCLTNMALTKFTSENFSTDPQVHALNILRALYRDTKLGEIVMTFVADGIKAALLGFRAPSWAVRNSATLLFSSLMTRIFGVARSRDEAQRKNTMTGRLFFMRFPSLFEFLLNELQVATKAVENEQVHQSLYPILLLLARLYPSVMEGTDSNLKLETFLPYLEECAYSSIWKTRVLAAQAIVPLLAVDRQVAHLKKILSSLSSKSLCRLNENKIHGILLQTLFILQGYPDLHPSVKTELNEDLEELIKDSFSLVTRSEACMANRTAYLNVIELILKLEIIQFDEEFVETIMDLITDDCIKASQNREPFAEAYYAVLSRISLMLCSSPKVQFKFGKFPSFETFLLHLLMVNIYEVRIGVLMFLKTSLFENAFYDEYSTKDFVLENRNNKNVTEGNCKLKRALLEEIFSSDLLAQHFTEMALGTEIHPGCLAVLFQVMSAMPLVIQNDWVLTDKAPLNCAEKLNTVLDKLAVEKQNDVSCALLYFSAHLCKNAYENAKFGEMKQNVSQALQRWAATVESYCSVESSEGQRKSAVCGLQHVGPLLFMDESRLLGSSVTCLWRTLVTLLQDDEWAIKEQAVQVVAAMEEVTNNGAHRSLRAMVPSLALDLVLKKFVDHIMPMETNASVLSCFGWLLDCDESCQKGERPFERNEMNAFAEEVIFTRTVASHLTRAVTASTFVHNVVLRRADIQSQSIDRYFDDDTIREEITMQELAFNILQRADDLVAYVNNGSSALSFVDRNFTVKQIKLYKTITFLHCFRHCPWFAEHQLGEGLDRILNVIKNGGLKFGSTFQLLKLVLNPAML